MAQLKNLAWWPVLLAVRDITAFHVPYPLPRISEVALAALVDIDGGNTYEVEEKVISVKPALSVTCLIVPDQDAARTDAEAAGVDPFGSVVWPSSLAAAIELVDVANVLRDGTLADLRVLEIGSGTGLGAFTAAALGANAIASDYTPLSLQLLQAGADAQEFPWPQGASVECLKLDVFDEDSALPPCDLLVCSDMLYDARLAAVVARRCVEAVSSYGAGLIVTSPPGRVGEPRFNSVLRKRAKAAAASEARWGGLSLEQSFRRQQLVASSSPATSAKEGEEKEGEREEEVAGEEEEEKGEVGGGAVQERGGGGLGSEEEGTVGPAEALAAALGRSSLQWDDAVLPAWADDVWGTPGFGRSPGSLSTEDDAVTQVLRYLPPALAEGFLSEEEAQGLVCFHGRWSTLKKMGRRLQGGGL